MMNTIDLLASLEGADDALETALEALIAEEDCETAQRILLRAGAWAAIATRLAGRIENPRSQGIIDGLKMAADICRKAQEEHATYTDDGWPVYEEPNVLAAEIESAAEVIAKGGTAA